MNPIGDLQVAKAMQYDYESKFANHHVYEAQQIIANRQSKIVRVLRNLFGKA